MLKPELCTLGLRLSGRLNILGITVKVTLSQ
jgi:hypothetical protein